jgi:CubicO group peptidase (beta-lactamase class C family)
MRKIALTIPSPFIFLAFCAIAIPFPALQAAEPASKTGPFSSVVQPFIDHHTIAGAVSLVASKDGVLNLEADGYADLAAQKPMTPDAIFWIASMTKSITATAFMMLVDEGKVKLDDPVAKYLPEFKDQWVATQQDENRVLLNKAIHPITIRNLLTHTAGLPPTSRLEEVPGLSLSLETRVRSYAMAPLKYQPGTSYEYSNADLNTIGRIIEVLSGMPYDRFMEERLFKPLGMKDTTFWLDNEQLARLAKAYSPNATRTGIKEAKLPFKSPLPLGDRRRSPSPAGGLFSTASDLSNFCRMLLAGGTFDGKRYLSEASLKQMTSVQTGPILINGNGLEGYGLGWVVRKMSSKGDPFNDDGLSAGSFGHKGAFKTAMWVDPDKQLVMISLIQIAGGSDADKLSPAFVRAATAKFGK